MRRRAPAEIVEIARFGHDVRMASDNDTRATRAKRDPRLVLEVRHLRLIQAIARERSVTRAAPWLHLSQSALSHQLLNLERDLGAKLFHRVGKRMTPTPAGAALIETAAEVLGRLAEAERAVRTPSEARTPVRVAVGCFTYIQWLAPALAQFGAEQPELDLQVSLGTTGDELQAVIADLADIAITSRTQSEERLDRRRLFTLDVAGLIAADHPLWRARPAGRASLRWSDLQNERILIHDLSESDVERLTKALTQERPPEIWRVQLTEAIQELARAGQGVGVVTHWPQSPPPPPGLVVAPITPRQSREFCAVWRRGNPRNLPLEALAARLGADLGPHPAAHANP
jgi:LysR family transcriptional regulator for metE and metH